MKKQLSMKMLFLLASKWASEKEKLVSTHNEADDLKVKYISIISFLNYVWEHKNDKLN